MYVKQTQSGRQHTAVYNGRIASSAKGLNEPLMKQRPHHPPPHLCDVGLPEVEWEVIDDVRSV